MVAKNGLRAALVLAGVLVGVVVTVSLNRQSCTTADDVVPPALLPVGQALSVGSSGLPDFVTLVDTIAPSVVNISVSEKASSKLGRRRDFNGPFGMPSPFERPERKPRTRRSLGSGFIIDTEGYILTNHHVVADASKIVVRLHDESEYDAEIIGTDEKTDIAVIRITDADDLQPVPLGDSDALRVGEWVLAVGNPFGLDHTVTAGIVSAKGRRISQGNPYEDFVQTDAAINPGNSGGPLINLAGQVVGINTAIFSRGGGSIGIGFSIPINMARRAVPQLKEHGFVTRGWLGVRIQPVDDDIAESLGLDEAQGALVASVFDDSPASEAGVEAGDVIVSFDGQDVDKSDDLPAIVAETVPGKEVELVVIRDGASTTLKVTVARMDSDEEPAKPVKAEALGLSVQDITEELAAELGIDTNVEGVIVSAVEAGSPAERVGIRPGDVIEQVANTRVSNVKEFREQLADRDEDDSVLVLVRRGDDTLFRVIKPDAED
jgi:serine protease Do